MKTYVLRRKNDVNVCTANDSSGLNNITDSSISQSESDDTDSFDSSESDFSRNKESDSTFSEHETSVNKKGLSVFYTNADNGEWISNDYEKANELSAFL